MDPRSVEAIVGPVGHGRQAIDPRTVGRRTSSGSALLADDALLTMPPEAARFEGSEEIGAFFAAVSMDGELDRIRLVPTRANDQPALAAYAKTADGRRHDAYGVMVFALRGDRIIGITEPSTPFTSRSSVIGS